MKRMAILVLLGIVLLCGCGAKTPIKEYPDGILGEWENKADMTDGMLNAYVDEQVMYYFTEQPVAPFVLTVTFAEDGTYSSVLNVEKSQAGVDSFVAEWVKATELYYADLIAYNELDTSVDQMMLDFKEHYGKSMKEKYRDMIDMQALADKMKVTGTYRLEGEKLYRSNDATVYETIMLKNNMLYILSSSDESLTEAERGAYPYKFERPQ